MSGATRPSGVCLLHAHHHAPELGLLPEVNGSLRVKPQILHYYAVDYGAGGNRTPEPSSAAALFSRTRGGGVGASLPLGLVLANTQELLQMWALSGPMRVLSADKHPWVFEARALPFSLSADDCSGRALSSREGFLAGNLRSLSSRELHEERSEYRWDERCEL